MDGACALSDLDIPGLSRGAVTRWYLLKQNMCVEFPHWIESYSLGRRLKLSLLYRKEFGTIITSFDTFNKSEDAV